MQVVAAEAAVHIADGKRVQAEYTGDDRHGAEVLGGTFRAPLRDHLIDKVIHG